MVCPFYFTWELGFIRIWKCQPYYILQMTVISIFDMLMDYNFKN